MALLEILSKSLEKKKKKNNNNNDRTHYLTCKWGRETWVESDGMVGETPSQDRKQVTALDAVIRA